MEYLDKTGLTHLWTQIVNKINNSGGGSSGGLTQINADGTTEITNLTDGLYFLNGYDSSGYGTQFQYVLFNGSSLYIAAPALISVSKGSSYYNYMILTPMLYNYDGESYPSEQAGPVLLTSSGSGWSVSEIGGSSSGGDSETASYFSGEYGSWNSGDSSTHSFSLNTSSSNLSHNEILALKFDITFTYNGSSTIDYVYEIPLDIIFRRFINSNSTTFYLFGLTLTINSMPTSSYSTSYENGTENYLFDISVTPEWGNINLLNPSIINIVCGFTHKPLKFGVSNSY